jgi:receptor expression-enhancing protein 5/6
MYPSYASFKAVELMRLRNDDSEAARWLTYWAVYGAINTLERLLDRALPWVPYYSTLKLALLLWLQVPRYSGAFRVSNEFARPLLRKIHRHVDDFLVVLDLSMVSSHGCCH